jgi:hypothetical protein
VSGDISISKPEPPQTIFLRNMVIYGIGGAILPPSSSSSSAICFSLSKIAINSCISIWFMASSLNFETSSLFLFLWRLMI